MKKGINVWSFPQGSIKDTLTLAKDAGFEGVELALGGEGELSLSSTDREIIAIKDMAQDMGLSLYSLSCGLCWDKNGKFRLRKFTFNLPLWRDYHSARSAINLISVRRYYSLSPYRAYMAAAELPYCPASRQRRARRSWGSCLRAERGCRCSRKRWRSDFDLRARG